MKPTQTDPIERVSEYVPPEDGDRIQSPKRFVLNKRQDDGRFPELW
jgi:hypothetical protein